MGKLHEEYKQDIEEIFGNIYKDRIEKNIEGNIKSVFNKISEDLLTNVNGILNPIKNNIVTSSDVENLLNVSEEKIEGFINNYKVKVETLFTKYLKEVEEELLDKLISDGNKQTEKLSSIIDSVKKSIFEKINEEYTKLLVEISNQSEKYSRELLQKLNDINETIHRHSSLITREINKYLVRLSLNLKNSIQLTQTKLLAEFKESKEEIISKAESKFNLLTQTIQNNSENNIKQLNSLQNHIDDKVNLLVKNSNDRATDLLKLLNNFESKINSFQIESKKYGDRIIQGTSENKKLIIENSKDSQQEIISKILTNTNEQFSFLQKQVEMNEQKNNTLINNLHNDLNITFENQNKKLKKFAKLHFLFLSGNLAILIVILLLLLKLI